MRIVRPSYGFPSSEAAPIQYQSCPTRSRPTTRKKPKDPSTAVFIQQLCSYKCCGQSIVAPVYQRRAPSLETPSNDHCSWLSFKLPASYYRDHLACHIRTHFPPPVGWLGFWDFSISPIICSKALATLVFNRALASVKLQLNSSASFFPSSTGTCRCSGLRSLLLPTITSGTQSAPCQACQVWPWR